MTLKDELKKMREEQESHDRESFQRGMNRVETDRAMEEMKRNLMDVIKMVEKKIETIDEKLSRNIESMVRSSMRESEKNVKNDMMSMHDEMESMMADMVEKMKPEDHMTIMEKMIDALKNDLPNLIRKYTPKRMGGGGGGSTLRVNNLSSQADGSTRTFTTTHRIGAAHALFYSGFPTVLLPTTDYTASGVTVTINSAVNPPVSGQSLLFIFEDGS